MKLEEIMKLLDAGYTKADIDKLNQPAEKPAADQTAKQPEAKSAEEEKPKDTEKPAPDPVMQKLDALINAIQLSNIAGMGTAGGQKMTAEDVVKNLFEIKKE